MNPPSENRNLEALLTLDDQAGPATFETPEVLQQRSDAAVRDVLAGLDGQPVARRRRRGPVVWLAAAGVLVAGSAAAMLGGLLAPAQPAPEEAPARASRGTPTPAHNKPEPAGLEPAMSPAAPEPVMSPAVVEDLLRRANRLRGRGQYARAEQTYLRAARGAGTTTAAYVARVAAADLRLEHLGDAQGAIQLYEAALTAQPDGPLTREIRTALARAKGSQ